MYFSLFEGSEENVAKSSASKYALAATLLADGILDLLNRNKELKSLDTSKLIFGKYIFSSIIL